MFLVELLQQYYDPVPHSSKPNEVTIYCPFCQSNGHIGEARLTLGINTLNELGHCHRCDWRAGGKNLFYQLAEDVNVDDVYETDSEHTEVEKQDKPKAAVLKKVKLPREYEPLWHSELDSLGKKALKYLTDRGISSRQIRKHEIGFCGAGKYGYRIILPISFKKRCVGFTARSFVGQEPKYLISDGEKWLYNYPAKRRSKALLLEGPFDVLNVEKYLSDYDCLGKQGSALTELQLRGLRKYKKIVLWPDPDSAGIEGAIANAKQLKAETEAELFGIPPKMDQIKDPGELSSREVRRAIKRIKPWNTALENRLQVSVLF